MKYLFSFLIAATFTCILHAGNGEPVSSTSIDLTASKIEWKGYKVLGQHDGYINFKSGKLIFEDSKLVGGELVVDMNTLTCTDLSGKGKDNLEGHLKSDDFFGVATFPTSSLKITKVTSRGKEGEYKVTANLTIKNSTKEIKFNANVLNGSGMAALKIDRSDFDIRYGSGSFFDSLGDKTIYDEFDLNVIIKY
ncbi:MAG: YceI family protein [Saprospiraceae bacterium]|nr:YceI family protein [Saprospiraceae bacterium]